MWYVLHAEILYYCWGSAAESLNQLKTDSQSSESDFALGTDHKSLPAVVNDAVLAARSLFIPYLWVDSLCFRQDKSGGDWEEHARIMNKVYGNSLVTMEPFLPHPATKDSATSRSPKST